MFDVKKIRITIVIARYAQASAARENKQRFYHNRTCDQLKMVTFQNIFKISIFWQVFYARFLCQTKMGGATAGGGDNGERAVFGCTGPLRHERYAAVGCKVRGGSWGGSNSKNSPSRLSSL